MIKQDKMTIRFMTVDDIERVMEVERDAFSHPWEDSIFLTEIKANKYAHYLVCEVNKRLIGFCGLWIVMDDAQITNIAIHSDFRGKGLGEELLRSVIVYLKELQVEKLSLEVRVSNEPAKKLYRKIGFKAGGIRKKYYADNGEDALVMWVNVDEIE